MSSNINPNNVNGNFPVAGQDNDSQGFRDNFTNILNNFTQAATEITTLQNSVTTIQSTIPTSGNVNGVYGNFSQKVQVNSLTANANVTTTGGSFIGNTITTPAGTGANLTIGPDGNADVIINAANVWLTAGHLRSTASSFLLANVFPTTANLFGNATSVIIGNVDGTVQARGNVMASNFLFANGVTVVSTIATGGGSTYTNANVTSYLPTHSGNIGATNINTTYSVTTANVVASQNITANNLIVSGTGTTQLAGNLGVALGAIGTTSNIASLFWLNATTVNAFGSATVVNMGATNGVVNVYGGLTLGSAIQFANLTTTQISAITPTSRGMTVYNYTTGNVQVYNGTKWANIQLS
jgi:hypothetical protein